MSAQFNRGSGNDWRTRLDIARNPMKYANRYTYWDMVRVREWDSQFLNFILNLVGIGHMWEFE